MDERRDAGVIDDATFARIVDAVREAGVLTTAHFRHGARIAGRISWKEGNSPVTEVDFAVDKLLKERLGAILPDAGWLSEETADTPARLQQRLVFVVDPIDGTRAFMEGDPRFAVSVAIVLDGRPVAAVVDAPALRMVYTARLGGGAALNGKPLHVVVKKDSRDLRLAGPRFLTDPVARELGMLAQPKVPSLALRFAQVAAGDFEAAIASTNSHDWDIAGADLVLQEAGASLRTTDGEILIYNRTDTSHPVLIAAAEPLQGPLRNALAAVALAERKRRGVHA